MAKTGTIKFKRGDKATRRCLVPISFYEAGATLGFTVKTIPDDVLNDSTAVINKSFGDSDVDISSDPNYAIYTMVFDPADTNSIDLGEDTKQKYVGEFQYTSDTTGPLSFPGDDSYIEVIIYADVRREVP